MKILNILVIFNFAIICAHGLYNKNDGVVILQASDFESKLLSSEQIWIVEFFAPWCGHCKNLVPEYKKAATALKGIAKVAAIDATTAEAISRQYGIKGFPTIKIFGIDKKKPKDYSGARTAKGFVDAVMSEMHEVTAKRLGTGGKSKDSKNLVVELNDSNFEKLVYNSAEVWLVEFFAPWCGHCKNLEPHWKAAAKELRGKVKLGAVDATVNSRLAAEFSIQGYPTIKVFDPRSKSASDAVDYNGGRTKKDIIEFAESKLSDTFAPPVVQEVHDKKSFGEACSNKQLCVIAFLPHLLDCQADCRKQHISNLQSIALRYQKNPWGWIWTEGGSQSAVEEAVDVGGFGYPALVAVNAKTGKYSVLRGAFSTDGIVEFLKEIRAGKGRIATTKKSLVEIIEDNKKWDGKDHTADKSEL